MYLDSVVTVYKRPLPECKQPIVFSTMPAPAPTLFGLSPALQDYLLAFVDLRSLQVFRSVSPSTDRFVASYLLRYLYRSINPFVGDADTFLRFLDSADAVISGSAAVAILLRTAWVNRDLDVYTSYDAHPYVVAYLLENEGYHRRDEPPGPHYAYLEPGPATIASVSRLRKGDHNIDVIQSGGSSALLPVAGFWCTALMNFVSLRWYCLTYVELTEAGRSLLAPSRLLEYQHPSPRTLQLMAKYCKRGFEFRLHSIPWHAPHESGVVCPGLRSSECPLTPRFFGDASCVSGSFLSYADLAVYTYAHSVTRTSASWVRGGHACGDSCSDTTDFLHPLISSCLLIQAPTG